MKYRVHLFAQVRVEHELDADSPEEAARLTFAADLDLHRRFDRPGQEYAEELDEVCLVDPLTDKKDQHGRAVPDYEGSQWLHLTEVKQPDGTWRTVITPALEVPTGSLIIDKKVTYRPDCASPSSNIRR